MSAPFRIGQGFDVHAFAENRKLILGGVEIPHSHGLQGHSDADVLIHAICDAILGAFALGDIGQHFPDTSNEFKNIDSALLLKKVLKLPEVEGWALGNLDCTIIAQVPKLSPYIESMRSNLASLLQTDVSNVSVKATTTERLGFTGRKEGIAAQATILFYKS